jgi:tRNA U34 5-methylaminomethyl-2-thiouridine-forming methyltransferase MnmC
MLDDAGTPYSPEYGDIYHSAESGPGQARHVFLGGNDLPARWAGARAFTILETGFGLGLNFLATRQAWRDDPARPQRLHFVSVEKHPFAREGLAELHRRYGELASLSAELQAAWPLPLPGLHRLHFEGGRVTLTLALGDVADVLPKLALAADAFFLDGFAPDRNAEMWASQVIRALARLARPGATLATYTTARAVRDAVAAAGFVPELRPGFGRKRQLLAARYAPRGTPRRRWMPPAYPRACSIRTSRVTTIACRASPGPAICTRWPAGVGWKRPVTACAGSVAACCSWHGMPATRSAWRRPRARWAIRPVTSSSCRASRRTSAQAAACRLAAGGFPAPRQFAGP